MAGTISVVAALTMSVATPVAGAHGPTVTDAAGNPLGDPYQRWVHASRMPVAGTRLAFEFGGCPYRQEAGGCVLYSKPDRVHLDGDAGHAQQNGGLEEYRLTLYHELGHVLDAMVLDDDDRAAIAQVVGSPGPGWWDGEEPAAERFAEAYALCSRYRRAPAHARESAAYSYHPSRAGHAQACRTIRRAAAN